MACTRKDLAEYRNSERVRIARDLHDKILQSAEGLILNVQSAIGAIPTNNPIRVRLESSLDSASALTSEGRDFVHALRTSGNTDLTEALRQVVAEIGPSPKMSCYIGALGAVRDLNPPAWDELYRIAREAIVNAFRPSGASALTVEVEYTKKGVFVRIIDNGCGIPEPTLERGSAD